MKLYFESWKRCTDFSGRSGRKEYWICVLINSFAIYLLIIFHEKLNRPEISILIMFLIIAILLTSFASTIRRIHDVGKSGFFLLFFLIPIGNIILLFALAAKGNKGVNEYGSDPKK
jgi:uncharacterized membrane protein YhaH (DUF805 family)